MSSPREQGNVSEDKVGVFTTIKEGPLKGIFKYNEKFNVNVYNGGWVDFDYKTGKINVLPIEQTPQGKIVRDIVRRHALSSAKCNRISVLNDIINEVGKRVNIDIKDSFFEDTKTVEKLMLLDMSGAWLISADEESDKLNIDSERYKILPCRMPLMKKPYEAEGIHSTIVNKAIELKIQIQTIKNDTLDKLAGMPGIETSEETAAIFIYSVSLLWELCRIGTLLINKLLEVFPLETPITSKQTFSQIIDNMMSCIKDRVSIGPIALVAGNDGAAFGAYYSEPYKQLFDRTDDFIEWREILGSLKQ